MGIMLGLGVLWVVTEMIDMRHGGNDRGDLMVISILRRIDMPSVLFFRILCCRGRIASGGSPHPSGAWPRPRSGRCLSHQQRHRRAIIHCGQRAAGCGSHGYVPAFPVPATYHIFWELLALCAGTGGSLLIIGSAAGVTMGIVNIDFIWYMRKMTVPALLGYIGGIVTFWLLWH